MSITSTEPPRGSAPQPQQHQMGSTGLALSSKWSSWTGGEQLRLNSLQIHTPLLPHHASGFLPSSLYPFSSLKISPLSLSKSNIHVPVSADHFLPWCTCWECSVPKLAHMRSAVEWKMLQNISNSKKRLWKNSQKRGEHSSKRWSHFF